MELNKHTTFLPPNLAIASVAPIPASVVGLGHRIGYIKQGHGANIIPWGPRPLHLFQRWSGSTDFEERQRREGERGAAPRVKTPDWERDREEVIKWEDLPLFWGEKHAGIVAFTHARELWARAALHLESTIHADGAKYMGSVKVLELFLERAEVCLAITVASRAYDMAIFHDKLRRLISTVD